MLINIGWQFRLRNGEKLVRPELPRGFMPLFREFIENYFRQNEKAEKAEEIIGWVEKQRLRTMPFLLRDICIEALDNIEFDPKNPGQKVILDAEEKIRRNRLANRIYDSKTTIELDDNERILLKRLINLFYDSPLVVAQAYEIFDNPIAKQPKEVLPKKK